MPDHTHALSSKQAQDNEGFRTLFLPPWFYIPVTDTVCILCIVSRGILVPSRYKVRLLYADERCRAETRISIRRMLLDPEARPEVFFLGNDVVLHTAILVLFVALLLMLCRRYVRLRYVLRPGFRPAWRTCRA